MRKRIRKLRKLKAKPKHPRSLADWIILKSANCENLRSTFANGKF